MGDSCFFVLDLLYYYRKSDLNIGFARIDTIVFGAVGLVFVTI